MKEGVWDLFEILVSVYEGFNLYYYIFAFLDYNSKSQRSKITYSAGAIIHTCIVLVLNYFTFYEGILGLIYMLFTLIYAILILQKSKIKTFFVVLSGYVWVLSINVFVATFISNISSSELSDIYSKHIFERFMLILIAQLLVTYVYRVTLKLFKKTDVKLQSQECVLIVIIFSISFVVIMLNHFVQLNYNVAEQHHKWLLLSNLGIIIINIVCYFMVIRLSKANSAKFEYELQMIDLNYKKQYAENIKSQHEEIRRIRHDMKQSYQVLQQFVVENKFNELAEYLPQICEQINKISSAVDTNHSIINAILNTKLSFAKSQGIKTLCSSVKQIHAEKIEEIDLCHLIGNMMDNAIEATLKIFSKKTKYVEVSITERNAMILITVRNSYEDVLIDEGLNTSKDNKANHGFGIKTIRKIAKKYQGSADFYIEGDLFCCSVMLQNI